MSTTAVVLLLAYVTVVVYVLVKMQRETPEQPIYNLIMSIIWPISLALAIIVLSAARKSEDNIRRWRDD